MENVNVYEPILDKKLDEYRFAHDDFAAAGELTVTITLSEYRALVAANATRKADIDKAEIDKFQRDNENRTLKEEVARLQSELYELKTSSNISKEEK